MSEKNLEKTIISEYASTLIPLCRLLKVHATNIMLFPGNLILMQPILSGIRNYMILKPSINYSRFIYSYISLPDISKINTKFRKTKSSIDWKFEDGTNYLTITNEDMEPYKTPIINNPEAAVDLINATYNNIPNWDTTCYNDLLCDEPNSLYTKLPDSFIEDMVSKKLCEIIVNNHTILLSKPFLGDLKKTSYVGYRVINETCDKMILQFKQSEDFGNIYTYAAFLIV